MGLIHCVESDFLEKRSSEDISEICFRWSFFWGVLSAMLKTRHWMNFAGHWKAFNSIKMECCSEPWRKSSPRKGPRIHFTPIKLSNHDRFTPQAHSVLDGKWDSWLPVGTERHGRFHYGFHFSKGGKKTPSILKTKLIFISSILKMFE